jgi:hypothetical protein
VDPGPFFYIHITINYLQALFTFLQTTIFYHTIRLILYLQQTDEIDLTPQNRHLADYSDQATIYTVSL